MMPQRNRQTVYLKDVCKKIVGGGTPSTKNKAFWSGDIDWISSADIHGLKDIRVKNHISPEAIQGSTTNLVPANTIIVVTRVGLGKIAITDKALCFNQDCQGLILDEGKITQKYALYVLSQAVQAFKYSGRGTTISGVTKKQLEQVELNLPTLGEQEKIVAKIEELFSEIDNSAVSLRYANELLEHLHLALLNDATTKKNSVGYRTLTLSDVLMDGRESLKTGPFGTLIGKKDYRETGVPIVGIENIGELKFIDDGFKKRISHDKYAELKSYEVKPSDILISRSGTVGEICVVPEGISGIISTNLIRVRVDKSIVLPEYFITLFKGSSYVTSQIKELCRGSSRLFLNQGIMKQINYPIPSIQAQEDILNKLDNLITQEGHMSKAVNNALETAATLKQSILAKAFKGELV